MSSINNALTVYTQRKLIYTSYIHVQYTAKETAQKTFYLNHRTNNKRETHTPSRPNNDLKSLPQNSKPNPNLILGDIKRRNKTQTAITGRDDQQAAFTSSGDQLRSPRLERVGQLNTQEKAPTPNIRYGIGEFRLQVQEAVDELRRSGIDGS